MKSLGVYIIEKIKELPETIKGLIVFDIDDTLLKVDSSKMSVYKKVGDKEIALSTEDFAKDPDAADPNKKNLFDLRDFYNPTKDDGALHELGDVFKKTISHAVNDHYKIYKGETDAEKKANVLTDLCKKYDKVVFVDDDTKNVRAARNLNITNLKVIKAWDE